MGGGSTRGGRCVGGYIATASLWSVSVSLWLVAVSAEPTVPWGPMLCRLGLCIIPLCHHFRTFHMTYALLNARHDKLLWLSTFILPTPNSSQIFPNPKAQPTIALFDLWNGASKQHYNGQDTFNLVTIILKRMPTAVNFKNEAICKHLGAAVFYFLTQHTKHYTSKCIFCHTILSR